MIIPISIRFWPKSQSQSQFQIHSILGIS